MTSTVLLTIPNMLSFGIIAQHTRTSVGTAVDDGWHSSVVHLAQAILAETSEMRYSRGVMKARP